MPIEVGVRFYTAGAGRQPFKRWLRSLDRVARTRVRARLNRIRIGEFGDCRALGDGVWEIRLQFGPGYRIYFGRAVDASVVRLCGGEKRSQRRDIERAKAYWRGH